MGMPISPARLMAFVVIVIPPDAISISSTSMGAILDGFMPLLPVIWNIPFFTDSFFP